MKPVTVQLAINLYQLWRAYFKNGFNNLNPTGALMLA